MVEFGRFGDKRKTMCRSRTHDAGAFVESVRLFLERCIAQARNGDLSGCHALTYGSRYENGRGKNVRTKSELTSLKARWRAQGYKSPSNRQSTLSRLRLLEKSLGEFPLKGLGVASLAVGASTLFGYLVLIDYVPPNLLGMVGLAGIASAWLFVLWGVLTMMMFGPTVAIFANDIRDLGWRVIALGQLGPVCLIVARALRSDPWGLSMSFLVLGVLAITGTFAMLWREKPRMNSRRLCLTLFALFIGGLTVAVGVFLVIRSMGLHTGVDFENPPVTFALWVLVLLVLISVNAALPLMRLEPVIVWCGGFVATALMVLVLGGPSLIVSVVAAKVGLRYPGVVRLQVPFETCRSVFAATETAATAHAEAGPVPACIQGVNTLVTRVQLRWGDSWLVSPVSINGMRLPYRVPRVSIPDKDIVLVLY